MTFEELLNPCGHTVKGTCRRCAIPAPHDQTLLESLGLCPHDTSKLYCEAIQEFLESTSQGLFAEQRMRGKISNLKKCPECKSLPRPVYSRSTSWAARMKQIEEDNLGKRISA